MRKLIASATLLVAAVAAAGYADDTRPPPEKGESWAKVSVPGMT